MNELQIIDQREVLGKDFKIYGDANNPLFLVVNIAEWLDHNKPAEMVTLVDETEKLKAIISHSGQNREMWFVTEDGLMEILFQSRKPIAKEFKKQVKEILRTIRKHGAYMTPQKIEDILLNPDTIIQLAQNLKAEQEKTKQLAAKVEQDKPKVIFADSVDASKTSILIGDLAKLVKQNGHDTGQKRLFEWLRENGYLIKVGASRNMPTQRAMDLGLFEVKESTINNPDGSIRITRTTKVTGKGQIYFINAFNRLGDISMPLAIGE